jgi:hypothetical protein
VSGIAGPLNGHIDEFRIAHAQLRLAPRGHVIGIDITAALNIGAARAAIPRSSRSCCQLRRRVWWRRCAPTPVADHRTYSDDGGLS